MRRLAIIVLLCNATVYGALCIITRSGAEGSALKPRLGESVDLGAIVTGSGQSISHTFVVRNSGTRTVHFLPVSCSCGCTSGMLTRSELAPGETADLQMRLRVKGGGRVERATCTLKDDQGSTYPYTLSATTIPELSVVGHGPTGHDLNLGSVPADAPVRFVLDVELARDCEARPAPADVPTVEGELSGLTYSVSPIRPQNQHVGIEISAWRFAFEAESSGVGFTARAIKFRIGESVAALVVRWRGHLPVEVTPSRLYFHIGRSEGSANQRRVVMVSTTRGLGAEGVTAECSAGVAALIMPGVRPLEACRVIVTPKHGVRRPGISNESVTVSFTDMELTDVVVPVTVNYAGIIDDAMYSSEADEGPATSGH